MNEEIDEINEEIDDEFYLQASKEIEDKDINDGTWARAFANSEGSEEKTKALYIKYRAKKLKEEDENYITSTNDDFDWDIFWFFAIIAIVVLLAIFGVWKLLQFFGILG